jgi:hypothetical protein
MYVSCNNICCRDGRTDHGKSNVLLPRSRVIALAVVVRVAAAHSDVLMRYIQMLLSHSDKILVHVLQIR